MTLSQLRRRVEALERKCVPKSPSSISAPSPKPLPTAGLPPNHRNRPTSSAGSLRPASACPPSPAYVAASMTPDEKAKPPTPNPWRSTCSPRPNTAATANSSAGNPPSLPRDHGHFPNWVRVRNVAVQRRSTAPAVGKMPGYPVYHRPTLHPSIHRTRATASMIGSLRAARLCSKPSRSRECPSSSPMRT